MSRAERSDSIQWYSNCKAVVSRQVANLGDEAAVRLFDVQVVLRGALVPGGEPVIGAVLVQLRRRRRDALALRHVALHTEQHSRGQLCTVYCTLVQYTLCLCCTATPIGNYRITSNLRIQKLHLLIIQ